MESCARESNDVTKSPFYEASLPQLEVAARLVYESQLRINASILQHEVRGNRLKSKELARKYRELAEEVDPIE